jgi:phenylacetate-CoA ligase
MSNDPRFYRPEIQTLPRERIARLQLERLRALLERIWQRPIPFFRRKLESAGMTPADVRSLDDLGAIPTTVKDDLRASEAEHPPLGDYRGSAIDDCVRIGCSTGTSGKPTLILWTRRDQATDLEAVCRGRWRWGLRPGSSLAHGHPFGMYGGGISFSKGIEALGLLDVPCAPPTNPAWTGEVVRALAAIKPEHYRFFGNVAAQYADAARAAGLDPERDLNLRVQGEDPKEQYKSVSAGLEALGMLGTACEENDGAHVAEDLAIAEVVHRDSGKPVGDGERGNLVVTVLEKDNAFLRYDLQDVVRTHRKPCPCGETHTRLFYEGRVKDIVAVAGREILPIDVLLALLDAPPLRGRAIEYQIARRPELRALPLRVEHPAAESGEAAAVAAAIEAAARNHLKVPVDLSLLAPGALPRFAFKAARVVDET